MIAIKKAFKNPAAILFITSFLLIIILFLTLYFSEGKEKRFSPSPSHIVINKWSEKGSRKKNICSLEFNENKLFSTKLKAIPHSQTMLVIKSENIRFMLYTKGKIFFSNLDEKYGGYGKCTQIIDISEMKEKGELNLLISPIENKKGRIYPDIILTSYNEYCFDLIYKNSGLIISVLFLFFCALLELIKGLKKLFLKDGSAMKSLYFSAFLMSLSLILILKNDISFFIINSGCRRSVLLIFSFIILAINITYCLCFFIIKTLPSLIGRAKTILY